MKRFLDTYKLLIFVLLTALLLVACERPVPGSEPTDENPTPPISVPTTASPALPTQIPVEENTGGEGEQSTTDPAAPEAGEGTGEEAPTEGGETGGEEAAGGETGEQTETPAEPETTSSDRPTSYIVQPGDTLFTIATRYNITVEALAAANNISNVNSLSIGDTLTIPAEGAVVDGGQSGSEQPAPSGAEQLHTVQAGENLYRIGLQYGFTVEELATYNNLANPNSLSVGQQIRIPPQS